MSKHLSPDTRRCIVNGVRRTRNKSLVARVFGVTRKTVGTWFVRAFHRGGESFKDRRKPVERRKVTPEVEKAVLAMRVLFDWGSGRIQNGLLSLPPFAREAVEKVIGGKIPVVRLSRTAINEVLKDHGLNGYPVRQDHWKFFRAKKSDELWQLDLKGPFTVAGRKFHIVVCVDDYSRYLVLCELFDHVPATDEILSLIDAYTNKTKRKPEKILTDRGGQFQESWKKGLQHDRGIEPLFAHPYYPQDKGKVERTIRNLAEEFVKLLKKFPEWLNQLKEYQKWYNQKRLHRGIWNYPTKLYLPSG